MRPQVGDHRPAKTLLFPVTVVEKVTNERRVRGRANRKSNPVGVESRWPGQGIGKETSGKWVQKLNIKSATADIVRRSGDFVQKYPDFSCPDPNQTKPPPYSY
jgi:hypothetical protein